MSATTTIHFVNWEGLSACLKTERWSDNETASFCWEDVTCPECLAGKNYLETFVIDANGPTITCKRCGLTSYNKNDIEQHYCPRCHVFHDDLWPPSRKWWIEHPDKSL